MHPCAAPTPQSVLQAAIAYDTAARAIKGSSAICNYPETAAERQNTEQYLTRVDTSARKRGRTEAPEMSGLPCAPPARKLTARQRACVATASTVHPFEKTNSTDSFKLVRRAPSPRGTVCSAASVSVAWRNRNLAR